MKLLLMVLGICAVMTLSVVTTPAVQAGLPDSEAALCKGTGGNTSGGTCKNSETTSTVPELLGTVTDVLLFLVGLVAIIMIIFAGFKFVTSGGDQAAVKSAKSIITAAVIGLIIAFVAWALVEFVLGSIT